MAKHFDGKISEYVCWEMALTPDQIRDLAEGKGNSLFSFALNSPIEVKPLKGQEG